MVVLLVFFFSDQLVSKTKGHQMVLYSKDVYSFSCFFW